MRLATSYIQHSQATHPMRRRSNCVTDIKSGGVTGSYAHGEDTSKVTKRETTWSREILFSFWSVLEIGWVSFHQKTKGYSPQNERFSLLESHFMPQLVYLGNPVCVFLATGRTVLVLCLYNWGIFMFVHQYSSYSLYLSENHEGTVIVSFLC